MILSLFHTFLYDPIYNGLIFLISVLPFGDVGAAIIILTVFVKLVLFPLSLRAAKTQIVMKELEPLLAELKEKYKENREELARKTMALYSEKGLNPFAVLLLTLIQIPIILALYLVFFYEKLPGIDTALLYSFVTTPTTINLFFIGFINVTEKSLLLAFFAAATQFIQIRLTLAKSKSVAVPKTNKPRTFAEDFQHSMQVQMQYVLPGIIFVVSWSVAAAIPLYFIVSNLFAIGQELYIRAKLHPKNTNPIIQENVSPS